MGARGASQRTSESSGAAKTLLGVLVSVAIIAASFFGAYSFASANRSSNSDTATSTNAAGNTTETPVQDSDTSAQAEQSEETNAPDQTTGTDAQAEGNATATSPSSSSTSSTVSSNANTEDIPDKYGIDVSELQGAVDWEAVAADGIKFAFIRLGYRGVEKGDIYEDETYKTNLKEAKAAGIERGAYFYSQALNEKEAEEEAKFVLKALDGEKLEYPVVLDYEVVSSGLPTRVIGVNSDAATKIAQTFCNTIEKAGYDAMIYGNTYDLAHYHLEALAEWPIWYAEYNEAPAYNEEFHIWQYSCTGIVEGINAEVDLNLDMRSVEGSKAHKTATKDPNELPELFRPAEDAS